METQPEIVAAAEALRTWIHAQRATWTDDETTVDRTVARVAPAPPVPVQPKPAVPPAPVSAPVAAASPVSTPAAPRNPAPVVAPVAAVTALPTIAPIVVEPRTTIPPPPVDFTPAEIQPQLRAVLDWRPDDAPAPRRRIPRAALAVAAAAVLLVIAAFAGRSLLRGRVMVQAKGTAVFDSVPAGTQVIVDGNPVGDTPVRVELPAGSHTVEFRLNSAMRTETINVAKGGETPLKIDWKARPTGTLQVSSSPDGAKVSIDGKPRGTTPLTLDDVVVGTHTVQIESPEGAVRRKVTISAGRTETVSESIYPGWLHVSAPFEVTVSEGGHALGLDATNRVLMKPGTHSIRVENRALEFSHTGPVDVEPGGTAEMAIDAPASTLTVTGPTGAQVYVDGVKAGDTPLTDFQVKLGTRDVMVVDPSGATRHATVTVTTRPAQLDISFSRP